MPFVIRQDPGDSISGDIGTAKNLPPYIAWLERELQQAKFALAQLQKTSFDLKTSFADFGLSIRALNILESETPSDWPSGRSFCTVEDLICASEDELLEMRNLGKTVLREIKQRLAKFGLRLRHAHEVRPIPASPQSET